MVKQLAKKKMIRDPIYGYIEIEETLVHNIVDTATFQRLRNIRQTSYAPLYPSSLHNRFVHSLGVYYLGRMAFSAIRESLKRHKETGHEVFSCLSELVIKDLDHYQRIFELACLLHDVGHSPFSHTGEDFYKTSFSSTAGVTIPAGKYSIYNHLTALTNESVFKQSASQNPAPHEIMSCIVALEMFGNNESYFTNDEDRSLFARCITGLQYSEAMNLTQRNFTDFDAEKRKVVLRKMFLNCIIQLLHSSVIDVDRLDYIIRDAKTMGYQSVSIDCKRLLTNIELVMKDDYSFTVGFHKNAISVIENAVLAHDNEKKWIQSHPIILYESFLLQRAIIYAEGRFKEEYPNTKTTLFSYDSLTDKGSSFAKEGTSTERIDIRYLGDADIIYLIKNKFRSTYAEEYFDRSRRRRPVWKSEAEFMSLYNVSERKDINKALTRLMINADSIGLDNIEITEQTITEIEQDVREAEEGTYADRVKVFRRKLAYVTKILSLCEKYGMAKSFVLISRSYFKSNFSKKDLSEIPVYFPVNNSFKPLREVSTTLSSAPGEEGKLIYFYYYPCCNGEKIDSCKFARELLEALKES